MNKTELVDAIAESADLTKVQAKAALESTLNAISETLKKANKSNWSVSVLLKLAIVLRVLVVTHKLKQKSRFLLQLCLLSLPVKH